MLQNEIDYLGPDYSVNLKAINPDIQDGSGIYTTSFLQSVGRGLSVGGEVIAQKIPGEPMETGFNLVGKWAARATRDYPATIQAVEQTPGQTMALASEQKIALPPSIVTLTIQQMVAIQASYFHRVSDRVELASELQSLLAGPRRDAVCSVSAKFDYKQACIRTQLDSQGKVALLFEERLFPGFSFLLAGELDHVKGTSRFGLGVSLEN